MPLNILPEQLNILLNKIEQLPFLIITSYPYLNNASTEIMFLVKLET